MRAHVFVILCFIRYNVTFAKYAIKHLVLAPPSKDTRNITRLNHFKKLAILGDPGTVSRDDAIFPGESLLREQTSPLALIFLPNQFQRSSNSVSLV